MPSPAAQIQPTASPDAAASADGARDGMPAPHLEAGHQWALGGQITTRHLLVRKLTDVIVLPPGKIGANERGFAADILIRTLRHTDIEARADVARRLAAIGDIPLHLQRYLMLSEIASAAPMLQARVTVPDTLLMEAAKIGYEHRRLIMRRDNLTGAIADTLILHGEADIIRHLLENDEIQLSEAAMDKLVRLARTDHALRDRLLGRMELRLDQALLIYWWMDTRQRKALLKRFMTDRSLIQDAMHELFVATFARENPDLVVKASLKLIDRRHRPRGRNGETVTMDVVEKTLTAARCNPTSEFCHAVGLLAGVSTQTAEMVLFDQSGESFAILCKSAGVSRSSYRAIISDTSFAEEGSHTILSEDKIEDLVGVFDSIARDYSRTILRYWDWRADLFAALNDPDQGDAPDHYAGQDQYFGAL